MFNLMTWKVAIALSIVFTKAGDKIRMQSDHEQVFWGKNQYCRKYLDVLNQGVVNSAMF